jgi:UDP-N-acetylmuramyl pentapeptide synthase
VITNIAPVHLEKVGNLEGVVRAKRELIDALPPRGTAVVPEGFDVGRTDVDVVRIGEDVRLESFGPPLLRTSIGTAEVNFSAQHLAVNAVIAFATARALGLEIPERIDVTFAEWRNQELPAAGRRVAHQRRVEREPDLDASRARAPSQPRRRTPAHRRPRRDGELGDYSDEAHREVAAAVEEIGVDVLIAVGERASVYGGRSVANADEAISLLREELMPGDCVLVKGARVLGLERVAEALAGVAA